MAQKFKLKKIKLGKKSGDFDFPEDSMPSPFPPTFDVDEEQMPEIKKQKVGGKYLMVMEVEQKSMRETDKDKARAGFEIVAYKVLDKKLKDMSDEDLDEMAADVINKG